MPEDTGNDLSAFSRDGDTPIEEGSDAFGAQEGDNVDDGEPIVDNLFEDDPKNILAAGQEVSGMNILAEEGLEGLNTPQDGGSDEAKPSTGSTGKKSKPKKEDGVRFSNLEEAEKETRALQSSKDKLEARLKELESAEILLKDIQNDPNLAGGLATYYKTGSFPGTEEPAETRAGEPAATEDGAYGFDAYGDGEEYSDDVPMTKKEMETYLVKRESKRSEEFQKEEDLRAKQEQFYNDQRTSFFSVHSDASEEDFKQLMEFASNPQNVTMENIYTLLHQNDIIEERAKVMAEKLFRRGGNNRPVHRQSIAHVGGGDTEETESSEEIELGDIFAAAKTMRGLS